MNILKQKLVSAYNFDSRQGGCIDLLQIKEVITPENGKRVNIMVTDMYGKTHSTFTPNTDCGNSDSLSGLTFVNYRYNNVQKPTDNL